MWRYDTLNQTRMSNRMAVAGHGGYGGDAHFTLLVGGIMSDSSTRKQCKKINAELDAMLKKAKKKPMAVRVKKETQPVTLSFTDNLSAKLTAYWQRVRQTWGM
jgi:hypothetical protein